MSMSLETLGAGLDALTAQLDEAPETFECDHCGETEPLVTVSHWPRHYLSEDTGQVCLEVITYSEDDNRHEVFARWNSSARIYPLLHVCTVCRDDNYTYCEDQDEWHVTDDCVTSADEQYASYRYARSNWYFCDPNNTWYRDEDSYNDAEREYAPEEDDNGSGCYSYGTNVIDIHGWPSNTSRDELCFGVELEMEPKNPGQAAQYAVAEALGGRDGDGRYILAEDGSLNDGVEVITLPYTLAEHSAGMWRDITGKVEKIAMSGSGTTNCGLHIHINRKPLSPLTVGKMLVFVNSERTEHLVTTVAQRTGASWARRVPKKFSDGRRTRQGDHYDALGITEHGTLELRIFRGNLRPERILKAIEFAHALVKFCQSASMLDVENPKMFVTYVRQNKKLYPNLCAFIQEAQGYGKAAAERIISGRQARTEV